jgi:uncharacterized integral membrane protein
MWIFRYFLPAVFGIALGIFVAQNLDQKPTIQFLFWSFYDVPLILIISITLIVGVFVRYYVIFLRWMERKRLEHAASKIVKARQSGEELKLKGDYSKDMEDFAEERRQNGREAE